MSPQIVITSHGNPFITTVLIKVPLRAEICSPVRWVGIIYPHFTNEETEAQRDALVQGRQASPGQSAKATEAEPVS